MAILGRLNQLISLEMALKGPQNDPILAYQNLLFLINSKKKGWDFVLHTSWCSDQDLLILRIRDPKSPKNHPGTPFTGSFSDVLSAVSAFIKGKDRVSGGSP